MGTRIVTGVVAALMLLAVLLFGGEIGLTIVAAALAAIAVFELLRAAQFSLSVRLPGMAVAAAAPLLLLWDTRAPLILATLYLLWVMCEAVRRHAALSIERAGLLCLLPVYAGGGFMALAALRMAGNDGLFIVFVALVIPWLSDTGAYFSGVFFGKHKLCPLISPKKTVEGLIGGMVTSVLAVGLTAWLYILLCGHAVSVQWWSLLLLAAAGAPLSVMGDLFASVIKRRFEVKDYGKIMPGHGGIMDRFDSVLPVTILTLLWIQVAPIVA